MTALLHNLDPNIVLLALVGLLAVIVIALLGRRLSITVGKVHAEITPNGGSSLRDAVDVIRADVSSLGVRIAKLEATPTPAVTNVVVTPTPAEA